VTKPKPARWTCTACGAELRAWFGRCPTCQAWNTVEEQAGPPAPEVGRVLLSTTAGEAVPIPVREAMEAAQELLRGCTGLGEVDRVLGGGLVPGSVVLLGGAPGIGKSTLLLQAGAGLAVGGQAVLYGSGEESTAQIAKRAERLGALRDDLFLLSETRIDLLLAAAERLGDRLAALVIDSIQTVYCEGVEGLPGNVSQIRAVTALLTGFAKRHGIPVIIVGHVTKDGQLAGPRLLEHLVDAVLSFEGDEDHATRLLRAIKNRYGDTQELGVFEMTARGLREVSNPSELLVGDASRQRSGACVTTQVEGARVLLLEVQALLSPPAGGPPRRVCVGVDPSRVAMLLAVLERHAGLSVLDHDVFVNVAGGIRLHDPAGDLGIVLALASSHLRKPLPPGLVAIGEVGLTGELRPAPRLDTRLSEAARLHFSRALAPKPSARAGAGERVRPGLELDLAETVERAVQLALPLSR
jgi:DNA repair protein RadA/Sms